MLVLKKAFITPDFDKKLTIVNTWSGLYSNALQAKVIRERQHDEILEWVYPNAGSSTLKGGDEVGNTCQFFVNSKEYMNWVGNGPSTLICTGRRNLLYRLLSNFNEAGVGKSHLLSLSLPTTLSDVSSVIFHRLRENPSLGISYFVFNHFIRDQTAEDVIRFLLRQIVAQLPTVPANVCAEYSRFKQDPHKVMPKRDKFAALFKSSLDESAESFSCPSCILLDAYDEFRNDRHEEREREVLRSWLSDIARTSKAKILIMTRPHYSEELERNFADAQVAEFKGDIMDVKRYLDNELQPRKLNDGTKDLIKTTILEKNKQDPW
jgi:hypothetical protein